MLQICDSTGHWTAVCDYYWGCNNAIVACRQLGFNDFSKNIDNINGILYYFSLQAQNTATIGNRGQKLDLVHIDVIATLTHHFSIAMNTPVTTDIQDPIVIQVETLSHYNAAHHKVI